MEEFEIQHESIRAIFDRLSDGNFCTDNSPECPSIPCPARSGPLGAHPNVMRLRCHYAWLWFPKSRTSDLFYRLWCLRYCTMVHEAKTLLSRAPIPPQVEHSSDTASSGSLIDVTSDHVGTAASDFKSQKVKTETQAERLEHEAEDLEHDAEKKAKDASKKAKAKYHSAKKDVQSTADRASKKIRDNSDNPVYIGNMVAVATVSAALGFGAYNKYSKGELDWKVVGIWGGVVGAFAVGDYYLSQYLFKNKYPQK